MSNAEHLIENALVCIRDKYDMKDFINSEINIDMVKVSFPDSNIENVLEQIWDMSNYVSCTWFYTESFIEQRTTESKGE